jgi:UDP-2,3-diacylglucosamine pyrophosphatase LpxH
MMLTEQHAFNKRSVKKDKYFLKALLVTVEQFRKESPNGRITISWEQVHDTMSKRFPKRQISKEGLRNRYRRLTDVKVNQITKRKDDFVAGRTTLEQRVLNEIKTKRPVAWLMERLGVSEDEIYQAVAKLQRDGFRGVSIYNDEGIIFVHNRVRFFQTIPGMSGDTMGLDLSSIFGGEVIRFGVVSDTHFGNKSAAIKELHKFYDVLAEEGISTVFHVGDLTDGYYMQRPTSVLEQNAVGYSNQLKLFVDNYPRRPGITTYCISGNHDYTHMRNGMANIGENIMDKRDDINYLGHNFGKAHLRKGLSVSLIHPTDGASAALSSKLRELIDRNSNRRSEIMLVGHYHKIAHEHYNGVWAYMVPSFEHKTAFMDDNNLTTEVAGMIFTVYTNKKGKIVSISTHTFDYSK